MFAANLEIPIMHCFDNNFVIPAAVSFESMLAHADQTYFYKLYVLHNNITVQNQEKLSALIDDGYVAKEGNIIKITDNGRKFANYIVSQILN